MTQHDPTLRLRHMLDHAREAVEMIRAKERSDLDRDRKLELSLVRLVEVVGEAASRLSREEQARFPSIPWAQVVGMRHRLIHGYARSTFKSSGTRSVLTCRPLSPRSRAF